MLHLYNTLTRQKEIFKPIKPNTVRMYVCGMTVYDYCHLGHARVMVVFDMVARWLRASGYQLTYVRNITDIDDKIIQRAADHAEPIETLTDRFITAMNEDAEALGVLRPDHEPRATAFVPAMVSMIARLIAGGYAYVTANGDVYYAVRQFCSYGKLSGKNLEDLRAGERVAVNPDKQDVLDFVLWKSAKAGEPYWPSPWGNGRPGWHIECSAMSAHYLGDHFDIHGGGADLQFPHHDNEIAQSEAVHQCAFVNYWLHNGFIRVNHDKMSKSLGNFFTIRDVLAKYDAEVVRFFILRAHYRSPLTYSDDHLDDACEALSRLYAALKNVAPASQPLNEASEPVRRFRAAMDDDFNTVEAVAILFELASVVNRTGSAACASELKHLAHLLGLLQEEPQVFLQGGAGNQQMAGEIEALIRARNAARVANNWAESDRLRKELTRRGVILEDGLQGTTWRRARGRETTCQQLPNDG